MNYLLYVNDGRKTREEIHISAFATKTRILNHFSVFSIVLRHSFLLSVYTEQIVPRSLRSDYISPLPRGITSSQEPEPRVPGVPVSAVFVCMYQQRAGEELCIKSSEYHYDAEQARSLQRLL